MMKERTERKHTAAGARLAAIHARLGAADETELEQALEDRATGGATTVVVETLFVAELSYSPDGAVPRIEYASTRTASSVA